MATQVIQWRRLIQHTGIVLLAACARNTAPATNPTPGPSTVLAPVPAPVSVPAPTSDLAVVPVRVTFVLRTLTPSLDSLFPVSDSLSAASCAAIGLLCHQYVYRREPLRLRA